MSRFLFVVPPLTGHVNPTVALAAALTARGHEVAWAGSELVLRPLLGADATVFPTGSRIHREQSDHGLAAIRSLWERFIVPFTRFTLSAVDRAVLAFQPDVLVVDQHTPAGALVAHRHGVRWATLASSGMELARPYRALPGVEAWTHDHLTALWAHAGLAAGEFVDPRFSPDLVIAPTTPELAGSNDFPGHYALVGPMLAARPGDPDFPFRWLAPGRSRVLVSTGTLARDLADDFNRRALAAVEPLGARAQVIIVAPQDTLPEPPDHVLVRERVPMLALLPHLDLVVSHGGLNTVTETLAHGIPLVVAPIRHDQPVNAGQVAAAGAGVRVSFGRVTPAGLRAAIGTVLAEPACRAAAERIRDSFRAAGGAPAAAQRLEALAQQTSARPVAAGSIGLRS